MFIKEECEHISASNLPPQQGGAGAQLAAHNIDPTAHEVAMAKKANVSSPNMWRPIGVTFPMTKNGVTFDYDPESEIYTANGTATVSTGFEIARFPLSLAEGETLTLSSIYIDGSVTASATDFAIIFKAMTASGGNLTPNFYVQVAHNQTNYMNDKSSSVTVTANASENGRLWSPQLVPNKDTMYNNYRFRVQAKKGSQIPWQPYRSLDTVARDVVGKVDKALQWLNLPLRSGFTSSPTAQYAKDGMGFLHLRGVVSKDGGAVAVGDAFATLPVGYYGSRALPISVTCGDAAGRAIVGSDGMITLISTAGIVDLEGVSFYVG